MAAPWKSPRPRRVILAVLAVYLLYIFFKNMPADIGPAASQRYYNARRLHGDNNDLPLSLPPDLPPPYKEKPPPREPQLNSHEREGYTHDGGFSLATLSTSLRRILKSGSGASPSLPGIVFASSDLRSVSDLVPLACQMARVGVNSVHFVLMGRDDVSLEGVQQVNGVGAKDCPVMWHDGRPDEAPLSTDSRMERAISTGLHMIRVVLRPYAIITQGESWEDPFFWNAARRRLQDARIPHVALPSASRNIMWLSTLNATAISGTGIFRVLAFIPGFR